MKMDGSDSAVTRSEFEELKQRVEMLERTIGSSGSRPTKTLKVPEFLIEHGYSTDADKVLLVAAYVERYNPDVALTSAEIKLIIKRAKIGCPLNISDCVQKNIRKGFMAQAEMKKGRANVFSVTCTGDAHIDGLMRKAGKETK